MTPIEREAVRLLERVSSLFSEIAADVRAIATTGRRGVPITDLAVGRRALNCFRAAGISTIEALLEYRPGELLKIPNFGRKCLKEVTEGLAAHGLKLRDD